MLLVPFASVLGQLPLGVNATRGPRDWKSAAADLMPSQKSLSEWNVVVHVAVAGAGGGHRAAWGCGSRTEIAALVIGADTAAASAAAALEHRQHRVEAL